MWDIYALHQNPSFASGLRRKLLIGPYEKQSVAWEAAEVLNTLVAEYSANVIYMVAPCKHRLVAGNIHSRAYIAGPIYPTNVEALKKEMFN